MSPIVGVDARLAVERGRGWGRYAAEFLKQISKRNEITLKILLPDTKDGHVLSMQLLDVEQIFHPPFESNVSDDFLQKSMASLDVSEVFGSIDVFHSLTRFVADTNFSPVIATVHDIAPLSSPPYKLNYKGVTKDAVERIVTEKIQLIAISEFTKSELISYTDITEGQISVIHQGVEFMPRNEPQGISLNEDCYKLLYVGGAGDNKNIDTIISCAEKLSEQIRVELHLVGDNCWGYEHYRERASKVQNSKLSIIFHDLISDQKLSGLYSSSDVFVFPSLHEGFGLPVIEAMIHQLPVCCSDIPIMHEVAGDVAQYFSPLDVESMHEAVRNVLMDRMLSAQMVSAGLIRCQKFNWDDSISKTLELYKRVVDEARKTEQLLACTG